MSNLPIEVFLGGGGVTLFGVVGYFLKKTIDKIDSTATAVAVLGQNVESQIDRLEGRLEVETKATKVEIVKIFQDICHERQGACGRLRDAMLHSVEQKAQTACLKAERIMEDRERRWEKQEQINDQIKRVLYATKDGGKSWQLRDSRED